jgi:hypothetical protein
MPEDRETLGLERISPNEILREAGAERPVSEGTFLERTGLRLAAGVGLLATVVTLAVVVKWSFCAPSAPVIPANADPASIKSILENYKTLQQITLEPYTSLFDSVVVKVLLPVFTTILGFIFGSRKSSAN